MIMHNLAFVKNSGYVPQSIVQPNYISFKVSFGSHKFFGFCKVRNHSAMSWLEDDVLALPQSFR